MIHDVELWGHLGHLDDKQQEVLNTVKELVVADAQIDPSYQEDRCLLRFCRARDFKVPKVIKMIKNDAQWRSQFMGRDFRLKDFASLLQFSDDGVIKTGGRDKGGRPVLYLDLSKFFPSRITSDEELVLFYVYFMDTCLALAMERDQETFTVICDLKGWTFANFSLPLTKLLVGILQNYYPERLHRVYVVHSPFAFKAAWNLVKPLIDKRTAIKIHLLGNDTAKILDTVDKSELEQAYGGTHERYPVRDAVIQPLYDKEEREEAALKEEQERQLSEVASAPDLDSETDSEHSEAIALDEITTKKKRWFRSMISKLKGSQDSSDATRSPRGLKRISSSFRRKSSFSPARNTVDNTELVLNSMDTLENKVLDHQQTIEALSNHIQAMKEEMKALKSSIPPVKGILKHSSSETGPSPSPFSEQFYYYSILILFALQALVLGMISQKYQY